MKKIKVIVVDDSALMRKIISDMLNEMEDIEVIDTARNGEDLFLKLKKSVPDIITLDIEMPKMNGIETLKALKNENIKVPVIMLSSLTKEGANLTMECLHLGAFDFIEKPSGGLSVNIIKVQNELVLKVRTAYEGFSKVVQNINRLPRTEKKNTDNICLTKQVKNVKIEAVVIGASTGGPKALYEVITKLPKAMGVPVFVVQHMPVGFTKAFADRLNQNSNIEVVEASDGEVYKKDVVYIAPGGFHMEVDAGGKIRLNMEPSIWGVRPAVDKLFISASKVFGAKIISAVLTGMGRDGASGSEFIKKNGGITISEDESTCVIYGMPKAAYETGAIDMVLPLYKVAGEIVKIVQYSRV